MARNPLSFALSQAAGYRNLADQAPMIPTNAMTQAQQPLGMGMQQPMPDMPMPHVKPNFGDAGGTGDKLATLGQYMMAYAGVPLGRQLLQNAEQTRREQTALERGEVQYQRQRRDGMQDWQQKQEWERNNPKPINNDTVNDYNFIRQTQGQAAADQYLKSRYDPIVNIPLPGGDVYLGPRSGMGGIPQGAAPQAPKGKLTPYNGGPTPGASGGFR